MTTSQQLNALENDMKAVRLIQKMNRQEQEALAMKLLLLKAQILLARHGESETAEQIGDFLSTPFAKVSCGTVEGHVEAVALMTPEADGKHGSLPTRARRGNACEPMPNSESIGLKPASAAGSGYQAPPAGITIFPERRAIVKTREERK